MNEEYDRYPIEYNDVRFYVNPDLFKKYSPTFAKYYQPGNIMKIRSEFPASAFEEFLPAVQEGSVKITKDNLRSISFFAKEWEVSELLKAIEDFESHSQVGSIITDFQKAIANKEDVSYMINHIASNLDAFIANQQFACIPIEYIKKILQSDQLYIVDYSKFLKFSLGLALLTDTPKVPSILNYLDVNRLTFTEINDLIKTGMINTEMPGFNANKALLLKNLIYRYREMIQETRTEIEESQNQKEKNEKKIGSICPKLKKSKKLLQDLKNQEQSKKTQEQQQSKPFKASNKPAKNQKSSRPPKNKNKFIYIPSNDDQQKSND